MRLLLACYACVCVHSIAPSYNNLSDMLYKLPATGIFLIVITIVLDVFYPLYQIVIRNHTENTVITITKNRS